MDGVPQMSLREQLEAAAQDSKRRAQEAVAEAERLRAEEETLAAKEAALYSGALAMTPRARAAAMLDGDQYKKGSPLEGFIPLSGNWRGDRLKLDTPRGLDDTENDSDSDVFGSAPVRLDFSRNASSDSAASHGSRGSSRPRPATLQEMAVAGSSRSLLTPSRGASRGGLGTPQSGSRRRLDINGGSGGSGGGGGGGGGATPPAGSSRKVRVGGVSFAPDPVTSGAGPASPDTSPQSTNDLRRPGLPARPSPLRRQASVRGAKGTHNFKRSFTRRQLLAETRVDDPEFERREVARLESLHRRKGSIREFVTGRTKYLEAVNKTDKAIPRPVRRLVKSLADKDVDVSHRALDDDAAVAIAECLRVNGCMTALNLSDNIIGDKGGVALAEALAANESMERLDLSNNELGRRTAVKLAEVVPETRSLKVLHVAANKLGTTFASKLSAKLDDRCPLEVLDVAQNGITGPSAGDALARLVTNARLVELDLRWNELGVGGGAATVLATLASGAGATLKSLDLSFNGLQDTIAESLGQLLVANTSLTKIDLSNNRLGPGTSAVVVEHLPSNSGLLTLSIGFNPFGVEPSVDIVTAALQRNTVITELRLENTFGAVEHGDEDIQRVWEHATILNDDRVPGAMFAVEYPPKVRFLRFGKPAHTEDPIHFSQEWSLATSIWGPRPNETDSGEYVDTLKLLRRALDYDWGKTKLARVIKDEGQEPEIKALIKAHYVPIRESFRHFCSTGMDPFAMTFNQWTEWRKAVGIESASKNADLDNVFVATNYELEVDAENPDRMFMRFELIEGIVRAAFVMYPPKRLEAGPGPWGPEPVPAFRSKIESVRMTLNSLVTPSLMEILGMADVNDIVSNRFRLERMYKQPVDEVLQEHIVELHDIYSRYSGKHNKPGDRKLFMSLDEWLELMHDTHLILRGLSERTACLVFLYSNMTVVDEHKRNKHLAMRDHCNVLTFIEFLEAVCRLCDTKALPEHAHKHHHSHGSGFGSGGFAGEIGDVVAANARKSSLNKAAAAAAAATGDDHLGESDPASGAGADSIGELPSFARSEADRSAFTESSRSLISVPSGSSNKVQSARRRSILTMGSSAAGVFYRTGCGVPELCINHTEPLELKLPRMIHKLVHPAPLDGEGSVAASLSLSESSYSSSDEDEEEHEELRKREAEEAAKVAARKSAAATAAAAKEAEMTPVDAAREGHMVVRRGSTAKQ